MLFRETLSSFTITIMPAPQYVKAKLLAPIPMQITLPKSYPMVCYAKLSFTY